MVIRTLAMAISSLVLAGCVSVGPNYTAPAQEPVVLQGAQQAVYSTASPVASWWAQFDDPVLDIDGSVTTDFHDVLSCE